MTENVEIEVINKGGRPVKFKTVEDFQIGVIGYIENCEVLKEMPNKAGLCVALKIHKDTLNEYSKKDGFSAIIKEFNTVVENRWVQRLNTGAPTGAIFFLKNAFRDDYRDKHEVAVSELSPADLLDYKN